MQPAHSHSVTWRDVFDGRAEVSLSKKATLKLAELAGAPWNDSDPDAKLSELQKEIVCAPERLVVVFGGSRGGKSVIGAEVGLAQLMVPNSRVALIGHSYEHCSKEFGYIWRAFFRLFPESAAVEAQNVTRAPHFSMRLTTIWGSSIVVYSTQTKEGAQLLGSEFDLVILCEAAQVQGEIFFNKVERALLGRAKRRAHDGYLRRTGRALLLTTPSGQGGASYELYSRAMARTQGDLSKLLLKNGAAWFDSMYFRECSVIELNPTYPIEAFEAARRTLPRHAFEEQFLGKALARSGLCYGSFKELRHRVPREKLLTAELLRTSRLGVGIDTGQNFAAVLVALTREGRALIIGELLEHGGNSIEHAAAIFDMLEKVLSPFGLDPREHIQAWIVDVNSQNVEDLELALGVQLLSQKYDLNDTIGHLDMRMGRDEVYLCDDLEMIHLELTTLRWAEASKLSRGALSRSSEKTKGEDHLLDAFRYVTMALLEMGPTETDPIAWTVDQMQEKLRNDILTPTLEKDLAALRLRGARSLMEAAW